MARSKSCGPNLRFRSAVKLSVKKTSLKKEIAERKRMEKAFTESEEKYRSVVENIGIGVAFISPAMEILALNKQMKTWFPQIDVAQKPICFRAFHNPPREDVCLYCPTCLTLKDGRVHESITETPAGRAVVNYRIISSPIKDKKGNLDFRATESLEMQIVNMLTSQPEGTIALEPEGGTAFKIIFKESPSLQRG